MIYLKLFLTFMKIGMFSFGGYSMIPLIREAALSHGWLTESELVDFIALSESTPGPIAVNIATFVGSSQAGVLGALVATLGVILPSFIIILVIAALVRNLLKYAGVQALLSGMRPCIVALILSTALTMGLETLLHFGSVDDKLNLDFRKLIILAILILTVVLSKKIKKVTPSPITLIILSAIMGIVMYGVF